MAYVTYYFSQKAGLLRPNFFFKSLRTRLCTKKNMIMLNPNICQSLQKLYFPFYNVSLTLYDQKSSVTLL